MINKYNSQHNRNIFPLNQRGFHQASRNNSHQIWNLLSWEEEVQYLNRKEHQETFETTLNQQSKIPVVEDKINEETKKSVSFKVSKNQDDSNMEKQKEQSPKRANTFLRSSNSGKQIPKKEPVVESELQKLKRKSVQKYLKDLVPYTRTLSNSAFRKFYQRPCQQSYGRLNTHTQRGAFYGNFMKTHNIQPHTLDNKPENYQSYTSALNYGKRTKLDLEDRWKRIERQLANNLDYRQLSYMKAVGEIDMNDSSKNEILKANIDSYGNKEGRKYQVTEPTLTKSAKSLGKMQTKASFQNTYSQNQDQRNSSEEKKRSKSSDKPLYYIYKYQESGQGYNYTRYARDRHGITCYVDNCFRDNDEAYTQFMKNIKPINPDKCKPEDVNIDQLRIKNHEKTQEEVVSRHYLIPNVEVPYIPQNYSRKMTSSQNQSTT